NKGNPHSRDAAQAMGRNNGFNVRWGNSPGQMKQEINRPKDRMPMAAGYKPKDLMMMPARVALALQADGWRLRSMLPWLKRNSMPESVTDRPANAVEYWFLFSKSARYFWDADAVRVPSQPVPLSAVNKPEWNPRAKDGVARESFRMDRREYHPDGRAFRNSDLFFQTWQGLLLDEEDEPLALLVNPAPYKGAHYATFPPKVLEPLIKASTSERGGCPRCGAPWERLTELTTEYQALLDSGKAWRTDQGKPDLYTNRQ